MTDGAQPKPPAKSKPRRKWYRRWWAWLLWGLLSVLLALALVAAWAWSNRYDILEDQVAAYFAEQGIEAQLEIRSVSKTRADLRDIRLRQNGETFLDVRQLTAEYQWREAVEGRFERLDFTGPDIRMTLDESFRITDGWLPPGAMSGGGGANFPARGIGLTDAAVSLTTPWTTARILGDAEIRSAEDFDAEVTLAPTTVQWEDIAFDGSAAVIVKRRGSELTLDGNVQGERLRHPLAAAQDVHLRLDGTADMNTRTYDGRLDFDTAGVSGEGFDLGPATVGWVGTIAPNPLQLNGDWSVTGTQARLPDATRQRDVATSLSLYEALSVVPVSEHFAPELRRVLQTYLGGSDIQAAGRIDSRTDGFAISLAAPASLQSRAGTLVLSPVDGAPAYRYDAAQDALTARIGAQFTRPQRLALQDVSLIARSGNGWRLDGVDSFRARIRTQGDWQAKDVTTGEPVRLGPLDADVDYDATAAPRRLRLRSAIDYDGPLPGAVVTGLDTAGRLDVRLLETGQRLDFTPSRAGRVSIARVRTTTDWILEEVVMTVPATRDIFVRRGETADIAATLSDVSLRATHRIDTQVFTLQAQAAALSGRLLPGSRQNWTVDLTEGTYGSDTLPGPGTIARFAAATLSAGLRPEAAPELSVRVPSLDAQTALAKVQGMTIALDGTPTDYTVEHAGGTVTLTAEAAAPLGALPAEGTVRFADGRFKGTARSTVPKTTDVMTVTYDYANGAGVADISIPSVTFAPKGLQPQAFVPALTGKIARVEGQASADIRVTLSPDAPPQSAGTVRLIDMNFGTAPGPLQGVNTEIELASVLPLQTTGRQRLTVRSFNPGLALDDGEVEYELVPEGVRVHAARWPLGAGFFRLDPFTWIYAAPENRVTLRLDKVGLGAFLDDVGKGKLKATGDVEGVFPIVISGIDVRVEGGRMEVAEGGVIQYQGQDVADGAAQSNEYAGMAIEALKNFQYDRLFAEVNGPLDGALKIGMDFQGRNPDVLGGQPFAFKVAVEGELLNIARSFNTNAQIKSEVLRLSRETAGQAPAN